MSIAAGVVVAVAFQQVDSSPDAKTGTQRDDESLKNGYCAVENAINVYLLVRCALMG